MTTQVKPSLKTLYEQDYNQWVESNVKHLQAKNYEAVDWENLIEEVADLSRRQRDKLRSLLTRLWEHLLKLGYWQSERQYNAAHWKREILNFRLQIKRLLQDSPSLQPFFQEIFEKCYENARRLVKERSQLPLSSFPIEPIATLAEILDENWFFLEN